MSAGIAVDPDEPVGEDAALEIGADLAFDEAGDGSTCGPSPAEKGDQLRADHLVKKSLLGLVSGVFGDGEDSAGTGRQGRDDSPPGCRNAGS